jgi:hypothetical protein
LNLKGIDAFYQDFFLKAEEGREKRRNKFKSLKVREASSSHLKIIEP